MSEPNIDNKRTAKSVHNSLQVIPGSGSTYVTVAAINKKEDYNRLHRISCRNGLPLGAYLYDVKSDTYHIDCADYHTLGYIPISYVLKMKDIVGWEVKVPIPDNVIKKYLTGMQKKQLRAFFNKYPQAEYTYKFVQVVNPN